jgi:energy-coupling factor transporter ATP-binding protein EcfA2
MSDIKLPNAFFFKKEKTIIPEGSPFENDVFGRKKEAEFLKGIISKVEQSISVAVTAAFGSGKSYFSNAFAQYLQNDGYKVVIYDAWTNDNSEDPYSSFATTIIDQLSPTETRKELLGVAQRIGGTTARVLTTVGMGLASKWLIGERASEALEKFEFSEDEVSQIAQTLGSAAFDSVAEARKIEKQFRDSFEKIITEELDGKIVVIIDELDRCRPEFAMELLERIKHLFNVKGSVFFLMIDEQQLKSMINVRYGSGNRSGRYLNKFVDWKYELKAPTTAQYIESLFSDYFKDYESIYDDNPRLFPSKWQEALNLIKVLSEIYKPTPRELNQFATRVFMKLSERAKTPPYGIIVSEYFNTFDSNLVENMKRFLNGQDYKETEIETLFAELSSLHNPERDIHSRKYSDAARDLILLFAKPHNQGTLGGLPVSHAKISNGSAEIGNWVDHLTTEGSLKRFGRLPYSLSQILVE